MKRSSLVVTSSSVLALAVAGALSAQTADAPAATATAPGAAVPAADATPDDAGARLARGKYMVTVTGCNDCHTPFKMGDAGPEPDMSRMLSGHPEALQIAAAPPAPESPWMMSATMTNTAWAGPWGVSFTANLTPDKETGLGDWSLQTFRDAIRSGRHMGRGRPILPPMPWPVYRHLTDQDLEAMFAYLQSIPAIRNKVPEPLPPPSAPAATTAETATP